MQLSNLPAKFNIPFASSAGGGFIRTIPQVPTGVPGQASLQSGFPPETFQPVAAGGTPPFGSDFNGVLNQVSAWNQWVSAGRVVLPYDATFQTAIGGYPIGAIVESLVENLLFYASTVDNNVTNPDTGGAGWIVWSRRLITNKDVYVNAAGGNDSNNGLSPATAKATIQAAINTAWTFPPNSSFSVTIHVATGTYASFATPIQAGPNCIVDGGTAATTIIAGGSSSSIPCCSVQGPNTLTLKNVTAGNTAPSGTAPLFAASNGATLTTDATISTACGGGIWESFGGGTVIPGNHTVSGSCYAFFYTNGGSITLLQGKNITISTAISVALATAFSTACGIIGVPGSSPPTFTNPGNVTGTRFNCLLNGVVAISGNGINYFPGTVAGGTTSGGQYA